MNGQAVSVGIIVILVFVIAFICIRNASAEKKRIRDLEAKKTSPKVSATITLRGDLAKQFQPSDKKLTKNQQYAYVNNMWVCPLCETFVSRSRANCFICDCPKQ